MIIAAYLVNPSLSQCEPRARPCDYNDMPTCTYCLFFVVALPFFRELV